MQCQILIFFSWKFVVDSTSQWWVKKIHGSHLRDKKMQHKAGERSLHCFFSFSNISSHLAKKPSYMEMNPLSNVGSSMFCLLMFCLESSLREEIFQQEEWGQFCEQLWDQASGHMSTTRAKLNFCVFSHIWVILVWISSPPWRVEAKTKIYFHVGIGPHASGKAIFRVEERLFV